MGSLAYRAAFPHIERRRSCRARIEQLVRVRPSDPDANQFQEVQIAVDASRDGLRFISRLGHWYVGMGLLVNFPYSRTESLKWDYLGRVVRLEQLDDGCLSVALRYMSRFNLPSYSTPAWRQFR